MTDQFTTDEEPTRPTSKEYEAARVVQLWSNSSKKDQKMILRLLELTARDNQPDISWH